MSKNSWVDDWHCLACGELTVSGRRVVIPFLRGFYHDTPECKAKIDEALRDYTGSKRGHWRTRKQALVILKNMRESTVLLRRLRDGTPPRPQE